MCRARSEGFLKLTGHMLHWFGNFGFDLVDSSNDLNSEIRSFSAMLFSKTFSDNDLEVSEVSGPGSVLGSDPSAGIRRDFDFSVFLKFDPIQFTQRPNPFSGYKQASLVPDDMAQTSSKLGPMMLQGSFDSLYK